ncbi:GatB/YqeY domain-containing protein [Pseudosulfitobacter pseudonitzschiae]|uniref:GatB/YqeY domain-containing protein n=1 Tax=Pseudosulfitobacter pseudonitzschiae TaxID=1402135 RepID=UPI003B7B1B87
MSLLHQIVKKSVELRKARSPLASSLTTLKGELETRQKSLKPQRDLTDDEVIATIKKTINTLEGNIILYDERNMEEAAIMARSEIALFEEFLPTQMTDDEIRSFVSSKIKEGANMGQIMGALKAEKAGLYDGKVASAMVKELLA